MKKLIPMLLSLLLLSGCSLERLMAMEIHESNPVSESTTALVFGGQEETGPVWVVTDAKTIAPSYPAFASSFSDSVQTA